jgi:hypothetical protein
MAPWVFIGFMVPKKSTFKTKHRTVHYTKPSMTTTKNAQTALILSLVTAGWSVISAEIDLSKLPAPAKKDGLTYTKDIRPLFEASCFRCHTGERPKAGLRLDTLESTLKGSKDEKVVIPGKSKESPLVVAVAQIDEEKAMPPKFKPGRHGPGGPGGPPPPGGPGAGNPPAPAQNGPPPGGPGGGPGHGFGPPPKPLTAEQVGLVRAWIDQGAK